MNAHLSSAASGVTVIGAGVVGLTTAIRLARAGFRVRILAKERTPGTTSDIAAAVWYPFHAGPPARALAWGRTTYAVLKDLARYQPEAGVTMVAGLEIFTRAQGGGPWWQTAVDGFRPARPEELPAGYVDGYAFSAPVVQMPVYLPWLEARFLDLGGVIEVRHVQKLDDLLSVPPPVPIVVNCTGLGAGRLVHDPLLQPIRGQIVYVAPGHAAGFVQDTHDPAAITYIIPRPDCTVLGGTSEPGEWDTTPQPEVAEAILARCRALVPGLADAAVLAHAVGLRPGRAEVRLEAETQAGGLVIHNYGHGGSGVTLSWGCAEEVVQIVQEQGS